MIDINACREQFGQFERLIERHAAFFQSLRQRLPLDQFQDDGIHYQRPLYVLLVDTVITAEERTWVLQATP